MTASPLYAASAKTNQRPTVVVTRSAAVYRAVAKTMAAIGSPRVMHMSPEQLRQAPGDLFWVVDARLPQAQDLIGDLLAAGRKEGMVLSSPMLGPVNRFCVKAGVPALLTHTLIEAPAGPDKAMGLSTREVQIVRLISLGQTNAQIGSALGITALTVKSHVTRMFRKTGASDRSHLVLLALRAGVIE
jgi:DNA-binding CsgD family transcriptional regulator